MHLKHASTSLLRTAFSLGIAIKTVMKLYKISFLVSLHVSAVVGSFAAIDLAAQGKTWPAITCAILSAVIAMALALWWIVQIAKYSPETKEIIKKGVDVISFASIAAFLGVIAWLAIWGEPPRVPEHWPIQVKIILWDVAPCAFGVNWLIIRYADAAAKRFPQLFSRPGHRGLLFYFALALTAYVFIGRFLIFLWG